MTKQCQHPKHTSTCRLPRTEHPQPFRSQEAIYLLAQQIFSQPQMHFTYDLAGTKNKLTQLLNRYEPDIWKCTISNWFGRLAQIHKYGAKATDTMDL